MASPSCKYVLFMVQLLFMLQIACKSSGGGIPATIIKIAKEELTVPIANGINKCISSSTFPDELKISDIIPVIKLYGIRKGYSSQNALLNLLKNWQKCLETSGVVETVIMDLSRAHDCLPHDLVIAKLVYGFDNTASALITDYLTNRLQKVKIGSTLSSYLEIIRSVQQGSILGPILLTSYFSSRQQKSATLPMILPYIHVH